ncbi:recombinase family protein [Vibrio campbellii]|uniref:recombinase family protein n=1 Tax=Vibrio campbellii TaxID=680 RepID=UPI0038CD7100
MNHKIRIYGYLRASTNEQDASRAKNDLIEFTDKMGYPVVYWFEENELGARLHRPELFRLLDIAMPGDIILVEQVDRISRLNTKDWEQLKNIIASKGLKVVALDLPTSHQFMHTTDEFTEHMLAVIARKDYHDRRHRQAQGVQRAKQEGKYKGRPVNIKLHQKIEGLLQDGKSYSQIEALIGCSRHTISKVSKLLKANKASC